MILLLFMLLPIPFTLIYYYILPRLRKSHNNPPGPQGLPIIGNLLQFGTSAAPHHVFLWQLSRKYHSSLIRMKFGSREVIVISSARLAKEALKTNNLAFSSRPSFIGQQMLSYNGLDIAFSPYGDYWRDIRKISVHDLLSSKRVKQFHPIREDEVSRIINSISKLAISSQLVNVSEIVMSLTSNIICRSAFGKRYDKDGQEKLRKLLHEVEVLIEGGFLVADYLPPFGLLDKITGKGAFVERVFQETDSFYQELIDEHLDPNRPKSMDDDILDILIHLMEENSSSTNLTWDHIKAVLMNVLMAGTDTTAAAIIWAMTVLIKEPRVMSIVKNEIRELVGNTCKVNEEDIKKLPYFKAVVKETLRLYPPGPLLIPKETLSKCTIDGYKIKPKTLIIVNAWAINRDPDCWENSHEFYPERFLDNKIDYKGKDFEFIPFGAGRRICPGMTLGIASTELALANLLYAFDWELPLGLKTEDIDTNVLPGLTMLKKTPLCLVAKQAFVI